jgi:hypothetical protein
MQRLSGGFHVAHDRPRLDGERQAQGEQQHNRGNLGHLHARHLARR